MKKSDKAFKIRLSAFVLVMIIGVYFFMFEYIYNVDFHSNEAKYWYNNPKTYPDSHLNPLQKYLRMWGKFQLHDGVYSVIEQTIYFLSFALGLCLLSDLLKMREK